jgi:hypothetical protein
MNPLGLKSQSAHSEFADVTANQMLNQFNIDEQNEILFQLRERIISERQCKIEDMRKHIEILEVGIKQLS